MPPKEAAEVFVSCVALIHHLAVDEGCIQKRHETKKYSQSATSFPKPKEIPAISTVIHNQTLFQALVSCLKSTSEGVDVSSGVSSAAHNNLGGPRKRTGSIDLSHTVTEALANKSAKLAHGQSPHTGKRTLAANHARQHSMQHQHHQQPQMSIRVTAATILYVALEPFDHWPVPLIEAYAEDCFGARTWVDDPACKLLVENLRLAHAGGKFSTNGQQESENKEAGSDMEAHALRVAEFYKTQNENQILSNDSDDQEQLSPKSQDDAARRRGSLSSTASKDQNGVMPMAPSLTRDRSSSFGSECAMSQPKASSPSTSPRSKRRRSSSKSPTKTDTKLGPGDDSDSGDEEEVAVATSLGKPVDDGESSSSGEDEEVFMEDVSVDGSEVVVGDVIPKQGSDLPPPGLKLTYPINPQTLKLARVRQRYFGFNMELAQDAISAKLGERLDIKSKQNSGLLQCLPSFSSIPGVRSLVTANLEKWLQSPALSGLARSLFSITVNSMKQIDPPLQADLDTLDNILSMRLKANQLNAHVENVTAVAKRIPTSVVANHIYGHLLRAILQTMDSNDGSFSDHVAMIHAVHDVLPKQLQSDAIASSLMESLSKPPEALGHLSKSQLVKRLNALIRTISKKFGRSFDCYEVLKALLAFHVSVDSPWTVQDEENKARLLFQCAILLVDPAPMTERIIPGVKTKLRSCRKLMLKWCCNDYAPMCDASKRDNSENQRGGSIGRTKKKDEIAGSGPPSYDSILDGVSGEETPRWMKLVRCVSFMERSESPILLKFLAPDGSAIDANPDWDEESKRVEICCDLGADLDDDMIWLVLKSCLKSAKPMPHEMGLMVLEHLFDCCSKERKPALLLSDPEILWKLYDLVEYKPGRGIVRKIQTNDSERSHDGDAEMAVSSEDTVREITIPHLAYSGMWWRVTGIALIMCGSSPETIGAMAWKHHPTLNALIKMVTSDRYRFPTVDCDERAREDQKRLEQAMRDDEARIAELLFLPPKKPKKKQKDSGETKALGSRVSRRQQEMREKMLRKEREKERLAEQAEAIRRKKTLRAATKSITILDPRRGPRKPPKESVDLIFSVGEAFDLPKVFQKNTEPDFVLSTIGSTSRSAIERAYDWLIPIISFLPDTISRLPASASCFLLLRAYGTQGEERSQLQKLSAPLLENVHDSLVGKFGEADAVRAFELLLTDLASHKPDRRRCARRVLQNALGTENIGEEDEAFIGTSHAWVSNVVHVEHINSILVDSVKKLAKAASFDRGSNLRYLILALRKLTTFAKRNELRGDWDFTSLLVGLISRRPNVFASAMSSFGDLCSLAIETIFQEFRFYINGDLTGKKSFAGVVDVEIELCCNPFSAGAGNGIMTKMPLSLLQSSCVVLSIWSERDNSKIDGVSIEGLANMLMRSQVLEKEGRPYCSTESKGLAGAKISQTDHRAVSVESWVMLAKSRSDYIAKKAALTAPTGFIPRLLLCSGLSRASLLTMVDRLGKLGESADDMNKAFSQLLVPSASSEWDIGRLGHRREIARKLLGRISAYSRMYDLPSLSAENSMSFAFVKWMSETCQSVDKPVKPKTKKQKAQPTRVFTSVENAGQLLTDIGGTSVDNLETPNSSQLDGDASEMTQFLGFHDSTSIKYPASLDDIDAIKEFLAQVFEDNMPNILEDWLGEHFVGFKLRPSLTFQSRLKTLHGADQKKLFVVPLDLLWIA
ncbi:MAG: hypothetical protein SGILL_000752 [Bacillariaceae sp.]